MFIRVFTVYLLCLCWLTMCGFAAYKYYNDRTELLEQRINTLEHQLNSMHEQMIKLHTREGTIIHD